jgi:hypothetical protein
MEHDKYVSVRYAAAQLLAVIGLDVMAALPHLIAALNVVVEVLRRVFFTLGEMRPSMATVGLLPEKPRP